MRTARLMILALLIVPFLMSFSFFKSKPRDYADMAREIRGKVAKKLAKKHQMDCVGVGGGMMGSVYMIGLSFEINRPIDRDEARARIVDCVEELLTAVNQNEEIRPYLKNYPFTTHNVQVAIFIKDKDRRNLHDPLISVVSVFESDDISYCTTEPNKMTYKNQVHEPYQEALAKVKGHYLPFKAPLSQQSVKS